MTGSRNYGQRFLEVAIFGYSTVEAARDALIQELSRVVKVDR